jgi:hypothetical protein
MNIWYAGTLIAAVLGTVGKGNARIVGHHIARALPIVIALGINFGVVPLLFIQVAYHQFFYPATILIAWPWFAVFWLVMTAYFAVYLFRLSIERRWPEKLGMFCAWIGAGLFLIVGFLFTNALSLMTRIEGWWGIFMGSNTAGAPTGLALNLTDPTLVPRWLFMFGIAITTTAVFVLIDAAYLSDSDTDAYRRYAGRFAAWLYTVGLIWVVGVGSWYIFGTKMSAFNEAMRNPAMRIIFPLTMVSPGLPWLLTVVHTRVHDRRLAALAGVAQFVVIVLNGVSRQWLQNVELSPYANLAARPVNTQTSALIIFLILFAAGMLTVGWIVSKLIEANRSPHRGER